MLISCIFPFNQTTLCRMTSSPWLENPLNPSFSRSWIPLCFFHEYPGTLILHGHVILCRVYDSSTWRWRCQSRLQACYTLYSLCGKRDPLLWLTQLLSSSSLSSLEVLCCPNAGFLIRSNTSETLPCLQPAGMAPDGHRWLKHCQYVMWLSLGSQCQTHSWHVC